VISKQDRKLFPLSNLNSTENFFEETSSSDVDGYVHNTKLLHNSYKSNEHSVLKCQEQVQK
jgi:hypothetical protein